MRWFLYLAAGVFLAVFIWKLWGNFAAVPAGTELSKAPPSAVTAGGTPGAASPAPSTAAVPPASPLTAPSTPALEPEVVATTPKGTPPPGATSQGGTPYQSSADFELYARMLREKALLKLEPQVIIPARKGPTNRTSYPWKNNIVTTVFWVGESKGASAWEKDWVKSYGGIDQPDGAARRNFIATGFTPRQNPFYCSLPYNEVTRGATKPEAKVAIPWFTEVFEREGQSICRDRWVRIRNREGKDCYAQWSDVGPQGSEHWQYVFGDERPKPNASQGAGLGLSPAVRDYLGLSSPDVTDWQFVDFKDVPRGPWSLYGDNNQFVKMAQSVRTKSPPTMTPTPLTPSASPSTPLPVTRQAAPAP